MNIQINKRPSMKVTKSTSVNFLIFRCCGNADFLLNVMFIFIVCPRNLAAGTPDTYEHKSQEARYTFTKKHYGEIMNGTL